MIRLFYELESEQLEWSSSSRVFDTMRLVLRWLKDLEKICCVSRISSLAKPSSTHRDNWNQNEKCHESDIELFSFFFMTLNLDARCCCWLLAEQRNQETIYLMTFEFRRIMWLNFKSDFAQPNDFKASNTVSNFITSTLVGVLCCDVCH